MEGSPKHEQLLFLGDTPNYLIKHGDFPDLPLVLKGKTVGKAVFDHGITASFLKRLPSIIAAPKSLFRSANHSQQDSVVVLTLEVKGSHPIIIPLRHSVRIGRSASYNVVTSIYAKEGPNPAIKWQKQGLLITGFE